MPVEPDQRERVRDPLNGYGRTCAQDAGIRVADQPAPLYQLLVLATLLSARISAGIAAAAARELFSAGCRAPAAMSEASQQAAGRRPRPRLADPPVPGEPGSRRLSRQPRYPSGRARRPAPPGEQKRKTRTPCD